jgi:hypothetical protein
MSDSHPKSEDRPAPPEIVWPKFQFSLRSQLILVTVVGIMLGLFVVLGPVVTWSLFYGLIYCLIPTPLIVGALFGRGEVRTFSIGALVPWIGQSTNGSYPLYATSAAPSSGAVFGIMLGITSFMLITSLACGVLAVFTRRWMDRNAN